MRYPKMQCDECGKFYPTEPGSVETSIFCNIYGNHCYDWRNGSGCWPKVNRRNAEMVAAGRGSEHAVERYWAVYDAGGRVSLQWELCSREQQQEISVEHERRKAAFREALTPVFNVGDVVRPFGQEGERFVVMCRMRCAPGNSVEDMYYVSWQSPQNSGEDPQYEELLLIHRRPDYGQSHAVEWVSVVQMKERTSVLKQKLVPVAQMYDLEANA